VTGLPYAIVSNISGDASHLRRLAESVLEQTTRPEAWIIVVSNSDPETLEVASTLERDNPWIEKRPEADPEDVLPLVAPRLPVESIVVVCRDSVSMESDYFERIVQAFEVDSQLGIAAGHCYVLQAGDWRMADIANDHVSGSSRAYRRACLEEITPLNNQPGWDGIDELRARALGWRARLIADVSYRDHRQVEPRRSSTAARWIHQGAGAHFMGYRLSYLVLRSLHHARRDPVALSMIWGYVRAVLRRDPRCSDESVRRFVRDQQRLSQIPLRLRKATGPRR
jgi:hypothetical protein